MFRTNSNDEQGKDCNLFSCGSSSKGKKEKKDAAPKWPLIFYAVISYNLEELQLLLKKDISWDNLYLPKTGCGAYNGCSVFHVAMMVCSGDRGRKILDLLLDHGANVNAFRSIDTDNGMPPLMMALAVSNMDACTWFLEQVSF